LEQIQGTQRFITENWTGSNATQMQANKGDIGMLMKMRESKGFTLVELMIVVAIIGILAAVAVPFYQRYVQKSRLSSLVFPGMHSIETNIGAFYAVRNTFTGVVIANMTRDADLSCVSGLGFSSQTLSLTIDDTSCPQLEKLDGLTLTARASVSNGRIQTWVLGGTLADELGLH
jgi:type IV pilus assembly protein PilA